MLTLVLAAVTARVVQIQDAGAASLAASVPLASPPGTWVPPLPASGSHRAAGLRMQDNERLRDIFGPGFQTPEERELARSAPVRQPVKPEPAPAWTEPRPAGLDDARAWETQRLRLWLEDGGADLAKVELRGGEVVTATDVPAGAVLFEVPEALLLTKSRAFENGDVGRDLRIMSTQRGTGDAGFDTFAIAATLAAERVRRGALRGRLRRQDGGLQLGVVTLADPEGKEPELLPQWEAEAIEESQGNRPFSPFISALGWTDISEACMVDPDQAEAVERGAELIARLVEPAARSAWMAASQNAGVLQQTSDEDVPCRANEALVLAMTSQLDYRGAPALVPLADRVLAAEDERDSLNARLDVSTRGVACFAARALPAGTALRAEPGPGLADGAARDVAPGVRVVVVDGLLAGKEGVVTGIAKKPVEGQPGWVLRLDGSERKVVLPADRLEVARKKGRTKEV